MYSATYDDLDFLKSHQKAKEHFFVIDNTEYPEILDDKRDTSENFH